MEQKNKPESRLFYEDCALINANDQFKVIAERGFHCRIGQTFTSVTNLSWDALRQLRTFHTHYNDTMLLSCESGTLILFSHLYPTTGLLLVLRIQDDEARVAEAVNKAQREVLSYPIFPQNEQTPSARSPLDIQIEEIYFYLNCILNPSQSPGFWTHCLRIANFAGCRLDYVALPVDPISLPREDYQRLTAFLLCVFLTLRKRSGRVRLMDKETLGIGTEKVGNVQKDSEDPESSPKLSLRLVHLSSAPLTERTGFAADILGIESLAKEFSFLKLPCFENFASFSKNTSLVFEAVFQKGSDVFSANSFTNNYSILLFEFEDAV